MREAVSLPRELSHLRGSAPQNRRRVVWFWLAGHAQGEPIELPRIRLPPVHRVPVQCQAYGASSGATIQFGPCASPSLAPVYHPSTWLISETSRAWKSASSARCGRPLTRRRSTGPRRRRRQRSGPHQRGAFTRGRLELNVFPISPVATTAGLHLINLSIFHTHDCPEVVRWRPRNIHCRCTDGTLF